MALSVRMVDLIKSVKRDETDVEPEDDPALASTPPILNHQETGMNDQR